MTEHSLTDPLVSADSNFAEDSVANPVSDTAAELVAAATDFEDTPESVARLRRALTAAELIVMVRDTSSNPELLYVDHEGLRWLPVWSSLTTLASHWRGAGRGDEEIRYGTVPGGELVCHGLPQLPAGTGVVLDPGQLHVLALPPAAFTLTDDISGPGEGL